ncbi:ABC transporter transmembrane domain-containing protein [uncultured Parvibaculum sp.]|uniref:ABC transporter transmembrane domain-containing protein n=1 Tax=uncultured Parvibaculum sp. TaxID=291828 RepID=UPI0030DA98A2
MRPGTVSVILVTHNSAEVLGNALASLPDGVEVIVVDNASKDNSLEIARAAGARCVSNANNLGFCKANNIGARTAHGEFLLLLNPDAQLDPGALETMLATAERYPDAAIVGPKLLDEAGQSVWRHKSILHPLEGRNKAPVEPEFASCVPLLTGAAMLCRRAALQAIEGLDENIFLYHDDDDLCLRLTQQGWSLIYEPAAVVRHAFGKSCGASMELTRFKAREHMRSSIYVREKHGVPFDLARERRRNLKRLSLASIKFDRERQVAAFGRMEALAELGRAKSAAARAAAADQDEIAADSRTLKAWIAHKLFGRPESSLAVIKRLFAENVRNHIPGYVAAFICMGFVAATTGASAWIMKDVINRIFVDRDSAMVGIIAGAVMAIYTIKGLSTYGQQYLLQRIGNNIVATLQKRVFDHVLSQPLNFFDRHAIGDLATRMSYNAQGARAVIDLIIQSIGRDVLSVLALTTVMVLQDPLMSVVMLIIMPVAVIGVSRLVKRVKKIMQLELQSIAEIVNAMQETASGIRIVKSFNLEGHMRKRMGAAVEQVEQRSNKITQVNALTSPLMETLGGFAVAAIIMYGGWNVIARGSDPGSFFAFITALLMAYEPAKRLARLNVQLSANMVLAEGLYALLDTPPTISEAPDARKLEIREGGRIDFDNVVFAYGAQPALKGVTFEARAGTVTALVGPSGAGKTTIFGLIERFFDPQEGSVSIDGQDLRGLTFSSLRDNLSLVTQETFLFAGTVRENIAYGRPGATDDEIEEAARMANAHEFITELPGQYEAPVGEAGGRLSGGQRQRVAIARAMLRDAPILLMDEPTSALDAQSESKVQEALDRLMEGRTTIVIAHRLSTVRNADRIYVLDRGEVVQSGSHDELLAEGGLYATLYSLQFRDATPKLAAVGAE